MFIDIISISSTNANQGSVHRLQPQRGHLRLRLHRNGRIPILPEHNDQRHFRWQELVQRCIGCYPGRCWRQACLDYRDWMAC
jgi:hypothetical protein